VLPCSFSLSNVAIGEIDALVAWASVLITEVLNSVVQEMGRALGQA
jgi:hypothetical protein